MTYNEEWNETTPPGGQGAYLGDDAIRQLKRGLGERFSDVFSNWPDGDPEEIGGLSLHEELVLEHLPAVTPVLRGTFAARPDPADRAGLLYWAEDTEQMFVSEGADPFEWTEVGMKQLTTGLLANRPDPEGVRLFFAADTKQLFISYQDGPGYTWGEISAQVVYFGSKPSFPTPPEKGGLMAWATDEERLYISLPLAGSFVWRDTGSADRPPLYVFDEGGPGTPTAWRVNDVHEVRLRVVVGLTMLGGGGIGTGGIESPIKGGEFDLNRVPDEQMNLVTHPLATIQAEAQDAVHRVVLATIEDNATARGDLRIWVERVDGDPPAVNEEVPVDVRLLYYTLVGAEDISA